MNPRGGSDLKYLEQSEFRRTGAEYFATKMQKLHNQIKEKLQKNSREYKCIVD
jgi:hypothetical protein